jgi:hypothetical protein
MQENSVHTYKLVANNSPQIEMAESMVDEFGVRKIHRTNTHPNRAKPWLLGKGDWERRRYGTGWGNWTNHSMSTEGGDVTIEHDGDEGILNRSKGRYPVLIFIEALVIRINKKEYD